MYEEYPQSNLASYLLAQRLNNRAAICIETGKFDIAIQNLTKAMQISQEGSTTPACTCKTCNLQACMAFSKQNVRKTSRKQATQDSALKARQNDTLRLLQARTGRWPIIGRTAAPYFINYQAHARWSLGMAAGLQGRTGEDCKALAHQNEICT